MSYQASNKVWEQFDGTATITGSVSSSAYPLYSFDKFAIQVAFNGTGSQGTLRLEGSCDPDNYVRDNGTPMAPSAEDGLIALALADAAVKSAKDKSAVTVSY